ncbi:MAG: hypothetical protein RL005_20, partial [Planctomycetota bacterium]
CRRGWWSSWGILCVVRREMEQATRPGRPRARSVGRHLACGKPRRRCGRGAPHPGALATPRSRGSLHGGRRSLFRDGRNGIHECHAVSQSATRRPQRPSGPALRGFGSREGGTNGAFGGGCRRRRATDESASEAGWSERVRAARARGSGRTSAEHATRARVERARPRSHGTEGAGGRARSQPPRSGFGHLRLAPRRSDGRRGARTRDPLAHRVARR